MATMKLELERDLALRRQVQDHQSIFPSFMLSRLDGGTQLPISNMLREYFAEYASRMWKSGPWTMPTSFNVVESFLVYSNRFLVFDMRDEREHLLRLEDYIAWYTEGVFPEDPSSLIDIMEEGVIYAYNFVSPAEDFHVRAGDSDVLIQGVALVRHEAELSVMALAGESPPDPPYDVFEQATYEEQMIPGKEQLAPDPDLSERDRYLPELPGYGRVLALTRFDLVRQEFSVRYVSRDVGKSFDVIADDPRVFPVIYKNTDRKHVLAMLAERLSRYDDVLAHLAVLIYLPAFFIAEVEAVNSASFGTLLKAARSSTKVKKAMRLLGREQVPFSREVRCFESEVSGRLEPVKTVAPPDLEYAESGFWRSLQPGEVGTDEEGNPIVGKTWVQRNESWSTGSLESFVLRKRKHKVVGRSPGTLYVMRSDSHRADLYKVGRTRRDPEERAREIAQSTGVPTALAVLASWDVGDVEAAEKAVHQKLSRYRVNKRREFFRAPIATIVSEIGSVVQSL